MYGVFNTSRDIPCVTNTEPAIVVWYRKVEGQLSEIIASSASGVNEDYIHQYGLTTTDNNDFTLRIKRVNWGEPQLW